MGSMSTELPAFEAALAGVPAVFRTKLIDTYSDLKSAWSSREYDSCGLRAGKFCEVMLRCLQEVLTKSHTPFGERINNFVEACRELERLPKTAGPDGLRVIAPRALQFVYTLRSKRDVGHVGGDVDANAIDAEAAIRCVDWCLAELMRYAHALSLEEAQELLDAIAQREIPAVWAVAGKKRILDTSLSRTDQTLLLLYNEPELAVPAEDLASWVEAPRLSDFRRDVLRPLHRRRLAEFDADTDSVILSPSGALAAEKVLLRGSR